VKAASQLVTTVWSTLHALCKIKRSTRHMWRVGHVTSWLAAQIETYSETLIGSLSHSTTIADDLEWPQFSHCNFFISSILARMHLLTIRNHTWAFVLAVVNEKCLRVAWWHVAYAEQIFTASQIPKSTKQFRWPRMTAQCPAGDSSCRLSPSGLCQKSWMDWCDFETEVPSSRN